jgi:hypothetical protein
MQSNRSSQKKELRPAQADGSDSDSGSEGSEPWGSSSSSEGDGESGAKERDETKEGKERAKPEAKPESKADDKASRARVGRGLVRMTRLYQSGVGSVGGLTHASGESGGERGRWGCRRRTLWGWAACCVTCTRRHHRAR